MVYVTFQFQFQNELIGQPCFNAPALSCLHCCQLVPVTTCGRVTVPSFWLAYLLTSLSSSQASWCWSGWLCESVPECNATKGHSSPEAGSLMWTQTNSTQVRAIKKRPLLFFWQALTSEKAKAQKVDCTWKKKMLIKEYWPAQEEPIPQGNPSTHTWAFENNSYRIPEWFGLKGA